MEILQTFDINVFKRAVLAHFWSEWSDDGETSLPLYISNIQDSAVTINGQPISIGDNNIDLDLKFLALTIIFHKKDITASIEVHASVDEGDSGLYITDLAVYSLGSELIPEQNPSVESDFTFEISVRDAYNMFFRNGIITKRAFQSPEETANFDSSPRVNESYLSAKVQELKKDKKKPKFQQKKYIKLRRRFKKGFKQRSLSAKMRWKKFGAKIKAGMRKFNRSAKGKRQNKLLGEARRLAK